MADTTAREKTADGWSLPSKYLPPVESRDLPEPLPFRKVIGASVIILATALGSGELIFWPYIVTTAGIGILWLAAVGFTIQLFLNMEIERYTLATGETAVTGFTRFWKPWGIVFILGAILPNLFPGWVTSSATAITYTLGINEDLYKYIAVGLLLIIGIVITLSPVIYNTIERVEMVLVSVIFVFLIFAIFVATKGSSWAGVFTQAPSGLANFPQIATEIGAATLLGAIAFAGAGGANNLVQSNYVRDKGLAMGARIPNIVSPITGEEEATPSLGYTFPLNEENLRRWRGWWKVANMEQTFLFWGLGLSGLIALSVLANSTIGVQPGLPADLGFIKEEAEVLGRTIAPWFATFFLAAAAIKLFSTNVGILDWVSRLTADSLKVSWLGRSEFWSESKIYITVIWTMITVGTVIILTGVEPLILLIIAASGGGVVMAFYSTLLIVLNRRALPEPIKLKSYRLVVIAFSSVFFTALSLFLLYQVFTGQIP
jgi:hypothetical protein